MKTQNNFVFIFCESLSCVPRKILNVTNFTYLQQIEKYFHLFLNVLHLRLYYLPTQRVVNIGSKAMETLGVIFITELIERGSIQHGRRKKPLVLSK